MTTELAKSDLFSKVVERDAFLLLRAK